MVIRTPEQIDELLKNWQQGDCILGDCSFLFGYSSSCPIKEGVEPAAEVAVSYIQELVVGFAVLTQTCDIQRKCRERPYIEVAALQVEKPNYHLIKKVMMPAYLAIPALESQNIVANLEKTMTFEKSVFSIWNNKNAFKFVRGFETTKEIKNLGSALSRKRSRFAFPDEFVEICRPFQKRIKKKSDQNSSEGKLLKAVQEIRVRADPDWSSGDCTLTFYFLINRAETNSADWASQIEAWQKLIDIDDSRFTQVEMLVVDYDDITAREYKESVQLDLDALSQGDS